MSDELSCVMKQQAEQRQLVESLSAKLNEANIELHASEEQIAKINVEQSAKQNEAKKLRYDLHVINSEATQELETLKKKTSTLGEEAGLIFDTLKNWRSVSN